jgi:serine/threonine protein kinase
MALASGALVGSYEILSSLGAGGMGEVYHARELKLGRKVAIKVLPGPLGNDPERIARFEPKARTLATLNHPNIAQFFGIEASNGIRVLVMELVDGLTLSDRIAKGAVPLDEVLLIAIQIAEALRTAHGHGILHRDLRPTKSKLCADGSVKVLDLVLATTFEYLGQAVENRTHDEVRRWSRTAAAVQTAPKESWGTPTV